MLCFAKRGGATFTDTVTLGHQHLSLTRAELAEVLRSMGRPADAAGQAWRSVFADELLVDLLGIERLVSIDGSDYEGATVVHDMNHPVPERHRDAYDAVVDAGTLEHVFNFPVAIANCMNMLRVGGRFFALTPANNHCGHGFYQFSPELFFRVFSPANGFQLEHVLAIEHPFPGIELSRQRTVYGIRDPAAVGERVGLVTRRPVYLFVQAVKRERVEPFAPFPQQSDYVSAWAKARAGAGTAAHRRSLWRLYRVLPFVLRRPLLGIYQRWHRDSFRNTMSYRKWDQRGSPPRV
jgi:SAM-dependent methyltransferase